MKIFERKNVGKMPYKAGRKTLIYDTTAGFLKRDSLAVRRKIQIYFDFISFLIDFTFFRPPFQLHSSVISHAKHKRKRLSLCNFVAHHALLQCIYFQYYSSHTVGTSLSFLLSLARSLIRPSAIILVLCGASSSQCHRTVVSTDEKIPI